MSAVIERPAVQAGGRRGRWVAPAACLAAAVTWVGFAGPIDPGGLGALGLIGAVHPAVLLAVAVLSAAFVLELRAPRPRTWLLLGMCVLVVLGTYGLPSVSEPVARLPVAWLHAGWSDYIGTNGEVLTGFDARFSWPTFFAFAAWLAHASGAGDVTALLAFAPPVFTGLAAVGVHAVAVALLGRGTAAWLSVWLFLGVNWVEQDYFSPQALAFLMYLGALVIVLRWLCRAPLTQPRGAPVAGWGAAPSTRVAAAFGLVLLIGALAPTHQVTPFALAAILGVLAVSGRLHMRWLGVLAVLTPLTWLVLGATDFWSAHLQMLTGGVGDLSDAVRENVGQRVAGAPGRMAVLGLRFGLAGLVLVLAAVGWWRLGTARGRPVALAVATMVPFGLVALQSYGGEMLLRAYLYALPLLCALGAVALDHWLGHRAGGRPAHGWRTAAIAAGLGVVFLALVGARGGNDGYVAFRREDVAVVDEAYRIALPGQRLVVLAAYAPLNWSRVGELRQGSLERTCPPGPDEAGCVRDDGPDLVVVNPAQDNYGVIVLGLPAGWTRSVVADLESGGYREHLRLGESVLLVRAPTEGHGGS